MGKTTSRADRKAEKRQGQIDRGNVLLDKHKGNGTRTAAAIIGKDFVAKMAVNIGTMAVSKLSSSSVTQSGALMAGNILSLGITVKSVNDLIDTRAAVLDRRKS